jgi:anti-anti-sigma factor
MALLPGTLSRAGPLSTDILDLQVVEHGRHARVVIVTGELDAPAAAELGAFLTAQLAISPLVLVDLDGVRFLGSAGLSTLVQANELASREDRDLRLVCNSSTANRALDATGVREHLTFADNVPDALKNLPSSGSATR